MPCGLPAPTVDLGLPACTGSRAGFWLALVLVLANGCSYVPCMHYTEDIVGGDREVTMWWLYISNNLRTQLEHHAPADQTVLTLQLLAGV
jgi:hypothetical protein